MGDIHFHENFVVVHDWRNLHFPLSLGCKINYKCLQALKLVSLRVADIRVETFNLDLWKGGLGSVLLIKFVFLLTLFVGHLIY